MIHFIHIGVLAGLAGMLLPLIIHLFARRKYKRIEFSTTVFLKELQNQKMRQVRLRQVYLLILRCLAILFLVLAFARPTCTGRSGPLNARSQSSIGIVIDRSFSMRRPGLFDNAQNRALAAVELLATGDEAMILWSGSEDTAAQPHFYQREAELRERIFQMQPSWEGANLFETIRTAGSFLEKRSNINKEILVISDFQASAFTDTNSAGGWEGSLFLLHIPSEPDNVTLLEGGIDHFVQPSLPVDMYAILKNYGNRKMSDLVVRVYMDGKAAAQKTVAIGEGEQKRIDFKVSPGRSGWIPVSIRLDNDSFSWDNEWHFALFVPDRRDILILGSEEQDILPFRLALKPDRRATSFKVRTALYGNAWTDSLSYCDVLILANVPGIDVYEAASIRQFVRNGGGLFIAPGDRTDLKSVNESLIRPLSGPKQIILGEPVGSGDESQYLSIEQIDTGHPLFKGVFEPGRENIRSPHFYRVIELMGNYEPVIRLENGMVLLGGFDAGRGHVMVFTSGLSASWSDMAISTFFMPMLFRTASFLSTSSMAQPRENRWTGDALPFPLTGQPGEEYTAVLPSGDRVRLAPETDNTTLILKIEHAAVPGHYAFYEGDSLLGLSAVNIPPEESDFRNGDMKDIIGRYPEAAVRRIGEEPLAEAMTVFRYGRELWREFLLAGLLLLIGELILGREGKLIKGAGD